VDNIRDESIAGRWVGGEREGEISVQHCTLKKNGVGDSCVCHHKGEHHITDCMHSEECSTATNGSLEEGCGDHGVEGQAGSEEDEEDAHPSARGEGIDRRAKTTAQLVFEVQSHGLSHAKVAAQGNLAGGNVPRFIRERLRLEWR
jgi:hypothetical protein